VEEINKVVLQEMITNKQRSIYDISFEKPCLLVFLRHFGCIFCREALNDIKNLYQSNFREKYEIILVHMSTIEIASNYFNRYQLFDIESISDPECNYYHEFGLLKGTFNQLFGFRSWIRGVDAGLVKGHGFGVVLGDGFQMPGVFSLKNGKIYAAFRHKYSSDKPDYEKFALATEDK
jgi:hypothetical protein